MNDLEQKIRRNFIRYGLFLGAILLALSIFSFYFITVISKSPVVFVAAPLIFSLVIPIILVVIICYYGRIKIGGYWSFKQATTGIFIMFIIAYLIQTVGRDLIFAKLIEPNMIDKTEAAFIKAATSIRQQKGVDQKQMDKNIADIKKNFADQKNITAGRVIQGFVISILMVFALALIFGALFKRDAPVYVANIEE